MIVSVQCFYLHLAECDQFVITDGHFQNIQNLKACEK